jgi:hypothetical protein
MSQETVNGIPSGPPSAEPRAGRVVVATLIDAGIVLALNAHMVNLQHQDRFRWGAIFLAILISPPINAILAIGGGLMTRAVRRVSNGASVRAYRAVAIALPLVLIPFQIYAFYWAEQWDAVTNWFVRLLAS